MMDFRFWTYDRSVGCLLDRFQNIHKHENHIKKLTTYYFYSSFSSRTVSPAAQYTIRLIIFGVKHISIAKSQVTQSNVKVVEE